MQEERRLVDLHTLYTNAQNFIMTPAQLNQAVDKAFDDQGQFNSDKYPGLSVWNTGVPEGIQDLLKNRSGGSTATAVGALDENERIAKNRLDRIAGELTGGKMGTTNKHS